jgi:hypothetical protein
MNVRPFRFVTATELSSQRAAADTVIGQWAAHWIAAGTSVSIDCRVMDSPPTDQDTACAWLCCKTSDADIWIDTAAVSAIGSSLLGSGADAAVGALIARSAAHDLLVRLAADTAAQVCDEPVPRHLWQAGRGVVSMTVIIDGKTQSRPVTLLVEKHMTTHIAKSASARRVAPQPVKAVIQNQKVELEVSLGRVEVELGVLRSLAVGDVLSLDRALDAGTDIRVCGERVACVGFLGNRDGQRCVALARA